MCAIPQLPNDVLYLHFAIKVVWLLSNLVSDLENSVYLALAFRILAFRPRLGRFFDKGMCLLSSEWICLWFMVVA